MEKNMTEVCGESGCTAVVVMDEKLKGEARYRIAQLALLSTFGAGLGFVLTMMNGNMEDIAAAQQKTNDIIIVQASVSAEMKQKQEDLNEYQAYIYNTRMGYL